MISVNQRIQSLEQELFIKRQELDGLRHQNETAIIKAQKTDCTISFYLATRGFN